MSITKVARTTLYAIASTAANAVSVGTAVDVSTYYAANVRIRMGRGSGTAFTVAPSIRLEGTAASGTPTPDEWAVLAEFAPLLGTSVASQAVSGTEAAGQTVITLAAGTNFAARDYVFFHNGTLANSEWSRVLSVSGADLTLEEAIVNAQTGATARDQAEQYPVGLDLTSIQKLRVVVVGGDQAVIVQADFGSVSSL